MAMLAVAADEDGAFEWHAHEAVGRVAGLTGADLVAIRDGLPPAGANDVERTVVDVTFHLLRDGDLDDQAFQDALSHLHPDGLQALMTLGGYYRMLALQLRVFRVGPPPW